MTVYDCNYEGDGQGEYVKVGDECRHVGSRSETVNGAQVTTMLGTHSRSERKVFNWDLAVRDAIAKRKLAERWAENNRRVGEIDKEVEELQKNWNQWFVGSGDAEAIFTGMVRERNQFCALPQSDRINFEKCESAKDGVTYIDTCRKGTGEVDQHGNRLTAVDTDPLANCRLRMRERIDNTIAEKQSAASARTAAASSYNSAYTPWMGYPSDWFYQAIEVIKDSDGNPIRYDWLDSRNDARNTEVYHPDCTINGVATTCAHVRKLPYYAPEAYYNGFGRDGEQRVAGAPKLLVTSNLEIFGKDTCNFFNNSWWFGGWGDARHHGIYCQRYPYNRAYEDWDRAKDATVEAEKTYEGLRVQFDKLKAEYDALRTQGDVSPEGAVSSPIAFGAEPALERADSRGSVGARPAPVVTP